MKIQPVVEGHGDAAALPILLRRLVDAARCWEVGVGAPLRLPRTRLIRRDGLERAVRTALRQPGCGSILILLDGDDDCPADLGPRMREWASGEAGGLPCEVVVAHREYEAWFLASLVSLRGACGIGHGAPPFPDPERPRDAKRRLTERMVSGRSYLETTDQPALSVRFSLAAAYQRSRSFRKMAHSFGALVRGMGRDLEPWPPSSWAAPPEPPA